MVINAISLSHLQATIHYAKDKEKAYPPPPPRPALGPCFTLVHKFYYFFIYYPDDYEADVCFSLSLRIMLYQPWILAREIRLDKLILPKNKCCLAYFCFSVADRRCPTPEIPSNGRVRGTNTTFGSVIKYRCSSSYKLQGPKTRTCRGNGKWDGETPICSQLNSIVMIPLFSVLLSHKRFVPLTVNSRLSDTLL